ncbi:MLO-like protein 5-like [Dorcoceras hygrometricum]|uniref:MLO-like protein n=1 Tax=Dorcoceras hygrometricum TaxID=472368 RepID=A0A2Z7CEI4_9LAMI|nr:MLO-like protein 5-like [Dorcoceras hygrometricum]
MAGGGGTHASRELDQTPTWAVSLVCAVIIIISILLEKTLHKVGELLRGKKKYSLVEALEKVKGELMVLGFISLLLTFGQNYITQFCIPERVANTMLPCELDKEYHGSGHRRLLWMQRRILAADSPAKDCKKGYVPLISVHGLHQLHIFIFFLAVFHVIYSAATMMLGRLKIRGWKDWEREIVHEYDVTNDPSRFRLTHETSFVRGHTSSWMKTPVLFYAVCFFRHMLWSVRRADYLTLRHGFISVHLAPGTKFNFQKYIKRSLEDDFKVVVGIPMACYVLAVNNALSVGTKLQSIITQMAIEIQERHAVVQGIPLVQVSDRHFWFNRPKLVLHLIHLTLFQNAFEITYFIWISYEFGLYSCFHRNFILALIRVGIGIGVQFLCSYITLPLYALVTQMGSQMKKSIFDEQTSKALMNWHNKIKKKNERAQPNTPRSRRLGGSPNNSPDSSPKAGSNIEMADKNSTTPPVHMADYTANTDLLTGP